MVFRLYVISKSANCASSPTLLLAPAFANNALNLIQSAMNAGRAVLGYVAANFARSTALTCLRSSSLDALRLSYAIGLQFLMRGISPETLQLCIIYVGWRMAEKGTFPTYCCLLELWLPCHGMDFLVFGRYRTEVSKDFEHAAR